MKESETYSRLRPALERSFFVERVENAILPGMPDVVLSLNNRTLFVEMKAQVGKSLRGSQVAWAMKRAAKGCIMDAFVVTKDLDKYLVFYMVDVAKFGGVVDLTLYHVVLHTPTEVARFLDNAMMEI